MLSNATAFALGSAGAVTHGVLTMFTGLATMSFQEITVWVLLWPGFVLMMLLVIPLPPTRKVAREVVRLTGHIRLPFMNISLWCVIAFGMLLISGIEFARHMTYQQSRPQQTGEIGLELEWKARKVRLERDMGMFSLATIIYFALYAIAEALEAVSLADSHPKAAIDLAMKQDEELAMDRVKEKKAEDAARSSPTTAPRRASPQPVKK
jgi:uncharacterized integral membrane protein